MLKRVIGSSVLLVTRSFILKFIGMLSTLVLARVLVPEDFGLVAMAMLVVAFIEVFGKTGAGQYVMRAHEVDDDLLQSVWTLGLIFRIVLASSLLLLSPLISDAYSEPKLTELLWAFAALMLLQGLRNSPGSMLLRRDQRYEKIAKVDVIGKILSATVAVTVAIIYESYWALVVGKAVSMAVNVVGSYLIHPARPAWNTSRIREIFGFSSWILLQAMFGYFRVQFDTLLVSMTFGSAQLGSFHTMKYLAFIPHSQILLPATTPLLREFSKSRDNTGYFAFQHNLAFIVGACVALSITTMMTLGNQQLVEVFLGSKWVDFTDLFFWFCLLIPALFMFNHATRVCIVFGRSRLTFQYEVFAMAFIFIPILLYGIDDVAKFTRLRVSLEVVASCIFFIFTTVRFTNAANLRHLVWCLTPLFIACATAGYGALTLNSWEHPFIFLASFGVTFAAIFALTLAGLIKLHWKQTREWTYLLNKALAALSLTREKFMGRFS